MPRSEAVSFITIRYTYVASNMNRVSRWGCEVWGCDQVTALSPKRFCVKRFAFYYQTYTLPPSTHGLQIPRWSSHQLLSHHERLLLSAGQRALHHFASPSLDLTLMTNRCATFRLHALTKALLRYRLFAWLFLYYVAVITSAHFIH